MPKRILIIGILFCLVGALAAVEIVAGALQSNLHLNFNIVLLPVGIGLLRGKERSRWWARLCIIIGYVILATTILISPFLANGGRWSISGTPISGPASLPYVVAVALIFLLGLYVAHRLLYSSVANDYFVKKRERTVSANAHTLPVVRERACSRTLNSKE